MKLLILTIFVVLIAVAIAQDGNLKKIKIIIEIFGEFGVKKLTKIKF